MIVPVVPPPNKSERVSAVIVRAATLSDELRSTIKELEQILKGEGEGNEQQ